MHAAKISIITYNVLHILNLKKIGHTWVGCSIFIKKDLISGREGPI